MTSHLSKLLGKSSAAAMGSKCTSTFPAGFPDDWAVLVYVLNTKIYRWSERDPIRFS